MSLFLANKRIVLGVTGGIAAYKSADLCRRLKEAGALVRVVMTENAKRFITPLTMQAVSGEPVHDDLFDLQAEAAMGHIELARWADVVIVAPASADFMARFAAGSANDLLTTLCLATKANIAIVPAMNVEMWKHTFTQENLQRLEKHPSVAILGPGFGSQACGEVGLGRMLEPAAIIEKLNQLFQHDKLSGVNVLLTVGSTHEAIDPVRYLTNGSSGKMGLALAQAAKRNGANVKVIAGPIHLPKPTDLIVEDVVNAREMNDAVMRSIGACDIFLAVAAVSDYRPEMTASQKIHKDSDIETLRLVRNPDIVANVSALSRKPFIVGFALETENLLKNAEVKRLRKGMNMIIANQLTDIYGLGRDENRVTVMTESGECELPPGTKERLAEKLIELIAEEYNQKIVTIKEKEPCKVLP